MKTHVEIDQRSLDMAREIVARVDADPARLGLQKARQTCTRWARPNPSPAVTEWLGILDREWTAIRQVLLDESAEGCRLRQNSPFCGVLTPRERWQIYRRHRHEPTTA